MTTTENEQTTPLPEVDEWLKSLTSEQIALLRRHKDSQALPLLVMSVLRTGPLSPMEVSNGNGHRAIHMPAAISQALSDSESG
jgi:uncharacterized protein YejL (UPF0352 family)